MLSFSSQFLLSTWILSCNPKQLVFYKQLQSTCFRYSGNQQYYSVPINVSLLWIKLWGAGGGSVGSTPGGQGGFTNCALAVRPGETLEIVVGRGGMYTSHSSNSTYKATSYGSGDADFMSINQKFIASDYQDVGRRGRGGGGSSAIRRDVKDVVTSGGGGGSGIDGYQGGSAGFPDGLNGYGPADLHLDTGGSQTTSALPYCCGATAGVKLILAGVSESDRPGGGNVVHCTQPYLHISQLYQYYSSSFVDRFLTTFGNNVQVRVVEFTPLDQVRVQATPNNSFRSLYSILTRVSYLLLLCNFSFMLFS